MLCFAICLSAVHNYMSRGIIRLAELPCWHPNTFFFFLLYLNFKNLLPSFQSGFVFKALEKKKKLCFLWVSFSDLLFACSFTPGSAWKVEKKYSGIVVDIRWWFCFDLFFHWFHSRLSCSSDHCLPIYLSGHPFSKFLLSTYCVPGRI